VNNLLGLTVVSGRTRIMLVRPTTAANNDNPAIETSLNVDDKP